MFFRFFWVYLEYRLTMDLQRQPRGSPSVVSQTTVWLVLTALVGPMSHAETVEMCEQLRARFSSKRAQAWTHIGAGAASCCLGEVDDGLEELEEGRALLRDLGDPKIKIIPTQWNEKIQPGYSVKGFVFGQ